MGHRVALLQYTMSQHVRISDYLVQEYIEQEDEFDIQEPVCDVLMNADALEDEDDVDIESAQQVMSLSLFCIQDKSQASTVAFAGLV